MLLLVCLMCLGSGFTGAVAGLALLGDSQGKVGPAGPAGPMGPPGVQGVAGVPGEQGPAGTAAKFGEDVTARASLDDVDRRLDAVEARLRLAMPASPCIPTRVVTDVTVINGQLFTDAEDFCLTR